MHNFLGPERVTVHDGDGIFDRGTFSKFDDDERPALGIGKRTGAQDLFLAVQDFNKLTVCRSHISEARIVFVVFIKHCEVFHLSDCTENRPDFGGIVHE